MPSSALRSQMLFLVSAGSSLGVKATCATITISNTVSLTLFCQTLLFLKLLVFLLPDVAITLDCYVYHHCWLLMFIHQHYVRLVSHCHFISLDFQIPPMFLCIMPTTPVMAFHLCFACKHLTPAPLFHLLIQPFPVIDVFLVPICWWFMPCRALSLHDNPSGSSSILSFSCLRHSLSIIGAPSSWWITGGLLFPPG